MSESKKLSEKEVGQLQKEEEALELAQRARKGTPEETNAKKLQMIAEQEKQGVEKCIKEIARINTKMQVAMDSYMRQIEQQIVLAETISKKMLGVESTSPWPKPETMIRSNPFSAIDEAIASLDLDDEIAGVDSDDSNDEQNRLAFENLKDQYRGIIDNGQEHDTESEKKNRKS